MQALFNEHGLPARYDTEVEVQVPVAGRVNGYLQFYSREPNLRLAEGLGSDYNPYPFTFLQGDINNVKGNLASNVDPFSLTSLRATLVLAARGAVASPSHLGRLFGALRTVSSGKDVHPLLFRLTYDTG
jgi:hypothetical protein